MLRVITDYIQDATALDNFALGTTLLDRGRDFH
jgi:hypothetical protein